jgi:hypothetical protein
VPVRRRCTLELSMGDERAKSLILARRARFVAAALASVAAVAQAGACNPSPCLEPVPTPLPDAGPVRDGAAKDSETPSPDEDSGGIPQPCLTTIPPDAESK